MSKHKHTQQEGSNSQNQITTTGPQEHADKNHGRTESKFKRTPEPKRVWGMTVFERIIAVLTTAAVLVAILTGAILWKQWGEMKVDQRPWIDVSHEDWPKPLEGAPMELNINLINRGKTPARQVVTKLWMGAIPAENTPVFDYKAPFGMGSDDGTIFPNTDKGRHTISAKILGPGATLLNPPVLNKALYDGLINGKVYVVVWGTSSYEDLYGTTHWTRFCFWQNYGSGTFFAKDCTDYNDIDNN